MWNKTKAAKILEVDYPIIQAGMAGGITTPELVAGVSNQGGLGTIGAGYLSPVQLKKEIEEVRQLTERPFAVNVFIPENPEYQEEQLAQAEKLLAPFNKLFDVDQFTKPELRDHFDGQIDIIIKKKVPVCSFTFGVPPGSVIEKLKKAGITLIGTATTVKEAVVNQNSGMDIVVLQGSEAGGHRGTFSLPDSPLIGTIALVPQAADQVSIPVIAAGGIMDGRGIAAALMLGGQGVQLGTAFIPTFESGAHLAYKQILLTNIEENAVLTKSFSGKLARGIENQFIKEMREHENNLLPYPLQNELTKTLRKQAAKAGNVDFMSLWAGQGVRLAKNISVKELFWGLVTHTEKTLEQH